MTSYPIDARDLYNRFLDRALNQFTDGLTSAPIKATFTIEQIHDIIEAEAEARMEAEVKSRTNEQN